MNLKDRKNILIGGLLFIVLLMAVAFAAFTTNLTIHGTSSINSNWCVGFDSSKTSTYVATPGLSGATTPTGQMTYSGETCQSSYKTIANLTSRFTQPGDKVVYTLTIANKSSMSAQIDSITLDGDSITSNTTVTKGNIKYTVEMPASTTLATDATTTMKVTAEFQNDTTIGNYTSSETASVDVRINTSEGSSGMSVQNNSNNYIYSQSYNHIIINDPVNSIETYYEDYNDMGANVFLRYTIENDKVTGIAGCFIDNGLHCLVGGASSYAQNKEILQTVYPQQGLCHDYTSSFECSNNGINPEVNNDGTIFIRFDDGFCTVNNTDHQNSSFCDFY